MRQLEKLSAKRIDKLGLGRHNDGNGLYLRITDRGKNWIFRYQIAGWQRDLSLGGFPGVSLAQARKAADEARGMLKGVIPKDPLDARKARKDTLRAERAKRITFKAAAEKYVDAHKAGWRNPKHAA